MVKVTVAPPVEATGRSASSQTRKRPRTGQKPCQGLSTITNAIALDFSVCPAQAPLPAEILNECQPLSALGAVTEGCWFESNRGSHRTPPDLRRQVRRGSAFRVPGALFTLLCHSWAPPAPLKRRAWPVARATAWAAARTCVTEPCPFNPCPRHPPLCRRVSPPTASSPPTRRCYCWASRSPPAHVAIPPSRLRAASIARRRQHPFPAGRPVGVDRRTHREPGRERPGRHRGVEAQQDVARRSPSRHPAAAAKPHDPSGGAGIHGSGPPSRSASRSRSPTAQRPA